MPKILLTVQRVLQEPGQKLRLLWYWFLVFSFLIIIPNLGFIYEVLFNQTVLPLGERIAYALSLYTNSFRYLLEPVALSIMVLSVLLALNFLVIKFVRQNNRQQGGRFKSTLAMLVSSHCVACGGSLLSPIISLLGGGVGTFSFSSSRYLQLQLFTITLNLIAMAITLRSIYKASDTVLLLTNTPRGYKMHS